MPLMGHEYVLYVTFFASNIVLRHPKCDALKNMSTPNVLEFNEIRRASYISRDDSNGEIHFFIRDLENKFWIFDRNYDFTLFQKLEIFRVLQKLCMPTISLIKSCANL